MRVHKNVRPVEEFNSSHDALSKECCYYFAVAPFGVPPVRCHVLANWVSFFFAFCLWLCLGWRIWNCQQSGCWPAHSQGPAY